MGKRFRITTDKDEDPVVIEVVEGDWAYLQACIEDDTEWDVQEVE